MGAWGDEPLWGEDEPGAVDLFSLLVIVGAFVALAVWGVWVALHPLVAS